MPDHSEGPSGGASGKKDDLQISHDAPEPPRLNPKLPAHPESTKPDAGTIASYSNSAIATSAVSSFVTPIIVLCLGGYWLDQRMQHKTPWFAMVGVVVGLVLGTSSLMRVLNRLSK
jgi:F0F1-type ATP synthase assembly protein I